MIIKGALWVLDHLDRYGGSVYASSPCVICPDEYFYEWGTLLKSDNVKWHHCKLTKSVFGALKPYLVMEDDDPFQRLITYRLNYATYERLKEKGY